MLQIAGEMCQQQWYIARIGTRRTARCWWRNVGARTEGTEEGTLQFPAHLRYDARFAEVGRHFAQEFHCKREIERDRKRQKTSTTAMIRIIGVNETNHVQGIVCVCVSVSRAISVFAISSSAEWIMRCSGSGNVPVSARSISHFVVSVLWVTQLRTPSLLLPHKLQFPLARAFARAKCDRKTIRKLSHRCRNATPHLPLPFNIKFLSVFAPSSQSPTPHCLHSSSSTPAHLKRSLRNAANV